MPAPPLETADLALLVRLEMALYNARPGAVASRARITAPVMSRIVRGRYRPSHELFQRILEAARDA